MPVLPGGAKIPVNFKPGQPLTANDLNALQEALMYLLLTHDHTGNEQVAPQGVVIGSEAIAPNAVKGPHISPNAVNKGDIHNGAVGASEIAEKCIGTNHIVDDAITTKQIKDSTVTLAKLADEVLTLLNTPREGATTYGYCAYLEGWKVYPTVEGNWWDWLLDAKAPVRVHDLPIRRLRDDGGWQPVRSILPPDQVRPILPNVDMTTRAEMAGSLAGLFKSNEATVQQVLGGSVHEVRAEGNQWLLSLSSGQQLSLADEQLQDLVARLGTAGADLSRMEEPLRTARSLTLNSALGGTSFAARAYRLAPINHLPVESVRAPINTAPVSGSGYTYNPNIRLNIDPSVFLNPTPSDDLTERSRTAMLIDPSAIGWEVAQEGATFFQPGIGGNAVFTETNQPIQFKPGEKPSREEVQVIQQMLYHFGLEDDERFANVDYLLSIPKVYDLFNNPQLFAVGYWTGANRNLRSVTRMQQNEVPFVRIRFARAYTDSSYVVNVTPDFLPQSLGADPIIAQVYRRRADYMDLVFLQDGVPINRLSFSFTIHGELVQS